MATTDEKRAALMYPVSITGEERHTSGALEGITTSYKIRHVDADAAKRWLAGVQANEKRGALKTVKLSARIVDTLSNETIEVVL